MFKEKMVTPAIPERVYALCKIVEERPAKVSELREKMEPKFLGQSTAYFSDYRQAAEELKLISISDNMVSLAVDHDVVKSITSMRRYVNGILEEFNGSQFYLVTQKYFELGNQILHENTPNVAAMAQKFSDLTNTQVDAPAMRGWRFWASFLGFGFLQDMYLIPNAAVFLEDAIENAGLMKNKKYSFGEFVEKILPYSRIILSDSPSNHQINYGVSNGLRTLHDSGRIYLEHILDQEDLWNLYPMKAHMRPSTVTHITLIG